jgi:hypothetical protein
MAAPCLLVIMVWQAQAAENIVSVIDFSPEGELPTYEWLDKRDFDLKKHAADPDRIEFFHTEDALHLRTKAPAFGMAVHEGDIPGAQRLRLHWGVSDYPEGVSYQHGIDNEAIMVYVFFGHERQPSGEVFIPDSPYFIGFYLCPPGTDTVGQPNVGHHYRKTGRYICVDHPPQGKTVISEVDLRSEFLKSFGREEVPNVSGISIEVDTTDADNDGHAAAFLSRLEFLD